MQCVKCIFQTQSQPVGLSHTKKCLSHENQAVSHTTFALGPTSWPGRAYYSYTDTVHMPVDLSLMCKNNNN